MIRILNIFCCCLSITSLQAQIDVYHLNGEIKDGIKEGKAYVRYFLKNRMVRDSASIKEGKFSLDGKLPGEPVIGRLSIKDALQPKAADENITEIYLEQGFIKLEANKNLTQPSFSGTASQIEFTQLYNALKNVRDSLKVIDEKYGRAQDENDLVKLDVLNKSLKDAYKQRQLIIGRFISKYPSSLVSAYKFDEFMGDEIIDVSYVEQVYNLLSPALKQLPIIQKALNRISLAKKTAPGSKAIDFIQTDTAGNKISLSSFRGKYLLIDFWAGWCLPCRAQNPHLLKMYDKYRGKGFEVLGVSLDGERKAWTNAIIKDGLVWPQVSDLKIFDNEIAKGYGITSIPQNILIDPEGKIIAKNLNGLALEGELERIFK